LSSSSASYAATSASPAFSSPSRDILNQQRLRNREAHVAGPQLHRPNVGKRPGYRLHNEDRGSLQKP